MFSLCVEYSATWECPGGFETCSVCVLNIQRRGSVLTGLRDVQAADSAFEIISSVTTSTTAG